MTNHARVMIILALCCSSFARAHQTTTPAQEPIRIEISQRLDAPPSWEKWVTLAAKIAWPVVAVLGLFLLRKPIARFLDMVGQRATKISIGSLGIELPTMNQAQLGDDVLTFRAEDPFMVVSSSAKRSLFSMFEQPGKFEFVAINLGRGQSWLSSRLYIFAIMLQRMKSLRCIVFLGAGPDTETQFLGATTPEKVRWGLARLQPWLETGYAQAYQQSVALSPLAIQNESGAMDPNMAEQIVRAFLNLLINPPVGTVTDNREWVVFPSNQQPEHATWLSKEYLEDGLGHILWKDAIVASNNKDEARALLRCSAPLVARVKRNREFISLIDRVSFLDEAMNRVSEKLEGQGLGVEWR